MYSAEAVICPSLLSDFVVTDSRLGDVNLRVSDSSRDLEV